MGPMAEHILHRPLGPPNLRPRCLTSILWGREGQPRPTAHGLWGGGLRGSPGTGSGGVRAPGHLPRQGCLCDAGEPPFPRVLDEGGRRVRPAMGLRDVGLRGVPCGQTPLFSRLEEVVAKAGREGSLMLIIGPAPKTRGGPRRAPCAPGGGSFVRTGPSTSGVART